MALERKSEKERVRKEPADRTNSVRSLNKLNRAISSIVSVHGPNGHSGVIVPSRVEEDYEIETGYAQMV